MTSSTIDIVTTVIGLIGGVANLLGAFGIVDRQTTEIANGLSVTLIGYFVSKKTKDLVIR